MYRLKHYKLVLMKDSDEDPSEEGEESKEEEVDFRVELRTLQIPFNNLKGLTTHKSFKVVGKSRGQEVVILVDTRATNNFISKGLALKMGLAIEDTPLSKVEVRIGQNEPSQGLCKGVSMEVQEIHIVHPFCLLELGGVNVVLGMQWLAGLGEIVANFQNLTMRWKENGELRCLQGDPAMGRAKSSLKAALKALRDDGEGYLITAAGGNREPEAGILV